jgi:glutathione S-transferase
MKLYIIPGACSLATNIALREADVQFTLATVDSQTKKVDDGSDFGAISSKGYVPALRLDDEQILTENVAVLQYIADAIRRRGLRRRREPWSATGVPAIAPTRRRSSNRMDSNAPW